MGKKQMVRNYVATSTNGVNSAGHVTQGDWLSSANLQAIFNRQAGSTKQLLSLCYFFHLNCCPSINRPFICGFAQLATVANKPMFGIIQPLFLATYSPYCYCVIAKEFITSIKNFTRGVNEF